MNNQEVFEIKGLAAIVFIPSLFLFLAFIINSVFQENAINNCERICKAGGIVMESYTKDGCKCLLIK